MLRWLIGGGREPQGLAEKSSVQTIGEEQVQNPYTELLVLKGHQDIVRFLVQIDEYRFASAGDDGIIFLWNAQTGEKLFELHGHTHKITAIAPFFSSDASEENSHLILTASADRTVISGLGLHYWQTGAKSVMFPFYCKGISALVELPKNCVAAAVGKELIIFRLIASSDKSEGWNILEVKRLVDHQDNILSLVSVNDLTFATGSHVGELIVWDALDWTKQASECNFWDSSVQPDARTEIKLSQSPNETSVQHLASDDEYVYAAVGKGIYVYNLQMKRVIACRRTAHDSSVLHIEMLPNRQLISCSEDGSVRIWELREKQQLPNEPVPTGFFNMWGFGRANKQANQAKKVQENTPMHFLELIGDLIGHSSAVQMFLYFSELGLVTCSADHLIILWKDGERESRLRSLTLFQKLAQSGDLQPKF
ncbi:WD repeat-containing protein 41 isoform X2 [Tympanuchus pallidicinctus]|uniref:WD repeat-containing protein 41 isoform X2 n=1 Tax=Tympanuchus pallidicinctus TaxID=109042 RepID=UPI002286F81F|nr:WD repeat-containing protein 41 isoform X2 [Tympanuchus pallidicinctus]